MRETEEQRVSNPLRSVVGSKRAACLLAMTSIAVGCSETLPPSESLGGFIVSDSAGVRKVVNHSPSWADGEHWVVSENPILTLGQIDGPEEQNFHRIRGATRLSDGRIAVLDAGSNELRFFGPTGDFLLKFGRTGDGPGEFRSPRYLERWEGDTIQITADWSRIRILPEGTLLSHELLQFEQVIALGGFRTEGCALPTPMFIREDILLCERIGDVRQVPPTISPWALSDRVVVASWSLQRVDTIGHFFRMDLWFNDLGPAVISGGTFSGGREPVEPPLGRRAVFWVGGESPALLYTSSDAYRIEVHDLATQSLFMVVEKEGGSRHPTDWEVEENWKRVEVRSQAGIPSTVREEFSVPDLISEIDRVHIDDTNAIWARYRPSSADQHSVAYDVFRPDGVWLGQVNLPLGLSVFEIGRDYVLGMRRDALGVEQVVLYQLNRG